MNWFTDETLLVSIPIEKKNKFFYLATEVVVVAVRNSSCFRCSKDKHLEVVEREHSTVAINSIKKIDYS